MSTILKIFVFPAALLVMCLGILTILGGHITPGGGFQGGAMIAGAFIFCAIVYANIIRIFTGIYIGNPD